MPPDSPLKNLRKCNPIKLFWGLFYAGPMLMKTSGLPDPRLCIIPSKILPKTQTSVFTRMSGPVYSVLSPSCNPPPSPTTPPHKRHIQYTALNTGLSSAVPNHPQPAHSPPGNRGFGVDVPALACQCNYSLHEGWGMPLRCSSPADERHVTSAHPIL